MPAFSEAQSLIAAMITPALLILASASLIATALVRLARVVDRVRKLAEAHDPAAALRSGELDRSARRARLALAAVALFFAAVTVVVAAGASIALDRAAGGTLPWLPVGLTLLGMALIVAGAAAMILESADSAKQIQSEIAALRSAGEHAAPS